MDKIHLDGNLKADAINRLRICVLFMRPNLSYGRGKAKEALEALKGANLKCSHATLNNDIGRLREIGVTNLDQIDLGPCDAPDTATTEPQQTSVLGKHIAEPARQLAKMIQQLEDEIATKKGDLEILRAASEIIKRRS